MTDSSQTFDPPNEALDAAAGVLDSLAGAVDDSARARVRERLQSPGAGVLCHPQSLSACGGALFLALDSGPDGLLLQVGGNAGECGLSRLLWQDSARRRYLYPFGSADHDNIRAFAEGIDRAFLPRPQRQQPAIAVGNRHPEISLPAVFGAFAGILHSTGRNLASTVQLSATREMTTDAEILARDGSNPTAPGHTRVSIAHLYHAGLWAAIRCGFRSGYSAEADHFIVGGSDDASIARSVEWVKEAIRHAAPYTKFTTDTSKLFDLRADTRHPSPWSQAQVGELFERHLTGDERRWVLDAFSGPFACGAVTYRFSPDEIRRLAAKFGPSLKLNEELFDAIARVRHGATFDFEPSLDEAETLTTPEELIFYMHWLRERGRPAQLVPPNLGFKKRQAYPDSRAALETYTAHKMWPELLARVDREFGGDSIAELKARVAGLAAVADFFDGTLSIHSGSGKQPEVLASIGAATHGRLNYKISGELQLQLFDVLSEQPAGSPERRLFEEMVEACEGFARAGAFGEESELASRYHASHGPYLGDASRGRVDGNLFLVFWLGNMVGSRDGQGRFFKQALDNLSAPILAEVRRRNSEYVCWLADNLFGRQ
jgi:hypothetical protein